VFFRVQGTGSRPVHWSLTKNLSRFNSTLVTRWNAAGTGAIPDGPAEPDLGAAAQRTVTVTGFEARFRAWSKTRKRAFPDRLVRMNVL